MTEQNIIRLFMVAGFTNHPEDLEENAIDFIIKIKAIILWRIENWQRQK